MTLYFELTPAQGPPARMALQPGLQRIKAVTGDRYRIYDEATGKTPPDIVVKRLDSHMIIEGLPDDTQVELTDFYARCGVSSPCTFLVDAGSALSGGAVEISPASPPLQALTDGSFVLYPSGYSATPAIAVAESEGFPRAVGYAVGGLAIAALAGAGGGGGGGSDAPSAVSPNPPAAAPAPMPGDIGGTPPPGDVGTTPPDRPVERTDKVAAVTAVTDNVAPRTGNVSNGSATNDNTPTVAGTLSSPLASGESLQILRNGAAVSATVIVEGDSWRVTDTRLADGNYIYTARVSDADGAGPTSAGYSITVDTVNDKTASITSVTDDVRPGLGTIRNGGTTNDSSPTLNGRLSAALAADDEMQILRDDTVISTSARITGTSWTFTDGGLGNGNYDYTVRIVDAAGNIGRESATYDIRVSLSRGRPDDDDDDDDADGDDDRQGTQPDPSIAALAMDDLLDTGAQLTVAGSSPGAFAGGTSSFAIPTSNSIDEFLAS